MATRKKAAVARDVAGVSPSAVRGFLRQSAELPTWTAADVVKALDIDAKTAEGVLTAMQIVGYIEPVKGGKYRNTEAGNAVAHVSKARPIKRETAEKALADLLARVKNLNRDDEYLYSVDKMVVFGPYFEGAEKIKDIDVAVELSPKEPNPLKLEKLVRQQAEVSEAGGKKFKSFADRRAWGRNKVLSFLKGKGRAVSLYEITDDILARPHKVVMKSGASHSHR